MTTIRVYKSYSFRTKDPVIDELRTIVRDSGKSYKDIASASNVSRGTLVGWFHGKTRRPQSAPIEAVGRSLGYHRKWVRG